MNLQINCGMTRDNTDRDIRYSSLLNHLNVRLNNFVL